MDCVLLHLYQTDIWLIGVAYAASIDVECVSRMVLRTTPIVRCG